MGNVIYPPKDIIILCCTNMNLPTLIGLGMVNKQLNQIIRTTQWIHFAINIGSYMSDGLDYTLDDKYLDHVLKIYRFANYYFANKSSIIDTTVIKFTNCHTLDLGCCNNITDVAVKKLGYCHTLNLSHCSRITDVGVKALMRCHTLNLL